ncbi:MAG: sensor histidine kinase [Chloroflexi bacterium]|nr:sensor histidine kinase [Chloroflexota bacterium]MBI2977027.1 sensor histidine kinase [Chloroflexota bacterium]MBI3176881.1 sensor histidine kinase [Chloroflexota bacterium]MBI4316693.1 sensor histidine kinase [Chloroflexota bacterium]MBI5292133.1 sensor histidine kinase [Chloroflexota bacterium]
MSDRDLAARRLLVVTEEELQHLVLDIHDGPVQNLFAALSQLSLLRARMAALSEAPIECAPALTRAIGLLELSLNDIRSLIGAFHAPEFAGRGLAEIIEDLAVQHETLTGGAVALEIVNPLPVAPLTVKIALYRILQEALSNIHRHAGVNAAAVRAWAEGERLCLEVADAGRGFQPPPLSGPEATERHEHIGLRGMRERAALVNGEICVDSRPGRGTRVRAEIPLNG